jgi:hypothetical protein
MKAGYNAIYRISFLDQQNWFRMLSKECVKYKTPQNDTMDLQALLIERLFQS